MEENSAGIVEFEMAVEEMRARCRRFDHDIARLMRSDQARQFRPAPGRKD